MDPVEGEAPPLTPDGIALLPDVGESPGPPDDEAPSSGPLAEPETTMGGIGAGEPLPPGLGVLPLAGIAPPTLLGGELDGKVGWEGGGVFEGTVAPGLVFWLLPPAIGEMIGARIGVEGIGCLSSFGSRE